ncbi:aminopeptidase [Halovenus rubra]|uniref:Aminopeptidase n=2 Tax=Halovenus rubra TaxID=869890 RepID=A0ACC7E0N3_9EURY|nr:aminopeptidase [Halovenus rubra]
MDPRVREHAQTLVEWSARIEPGDDVVVSVGEGAHALGVAVAEKLGDVGANYHAVYSSSEMNRAYLRAHDGEFDESPAFKHSLYKQADSVLSLRGTRNTSAAADVSEDTQQAYGKARGELREARMDTDWVSTVHPTRALAQQAGMSYETYCNFVYDAILRDWSTLADEMAKLKSILDDGREVTIRKESDGTELTMSIDNRTAVNSAASVAYNSHNLPSGEVFTAPCATEGEVTFDVPMTVRGTQLRDAWLAFEDGEVVDWKASQGTDVLSSIIETDDGASRLGELGIGMNHGIDRVTDQILFDEKMGGTVHLALGRAYDANLPDGESGNNSAVHVDLITDMREAGTELTVDGDLIQRNGFFRWEDKF